MLHLPLASSIIVSNFWATCITRPWLETSISSCINSLCCLNRFNIDSNLESNGCQSSVIANGHFRPKTGQHVRNGQKRVKNDLIMEHPEGASDLLDFCLAKILHASKQNRSRSEYTRARALMIRVGIDSSLRRLSDSSFSRNSSYAGRTLCICANISQILSRKVTWFVPSCKMLARRQNLFSCNMPETLSE